MKINKILIISISSISLLTACQRNAYQEVSAREFMSRVSLAKSDPIEYYSATLTYKVGSKSETRASYKGYFVSFKSQWDFESGNIITKQFISYVGKSPDSRDYYGIEVRYYVSRKGFQIKYEAQMEELKRFTIKYNEYAYLTYYEEYCLSLDTLEKISIKYEL